MPQALADEGRSQGSPFAKIMFAVGLLVLMAVGVVVYWFVWMRPFVKSDDARFGGHMVDLAPEISGTLAAVNLKEGDRVARGQVAFQLDTAIARAALVKAEAAVETAKGALAAARSRGRRAANGALPEEIKAAEAATAAAETQERFAANELARMESLHNSGAATTEDLDRARTVHESAMHVHEAASQNLSLLKQGTRAEDILTVQAQVAEAEGKLAEAEASAAMARVDVEKSAVTSPFDGWVVRRWLDPGSMVQSGRPILTVFDPSTLEVDANIEEKFLHKVAIGDAVGIAVDAYPDLKLKGTITQILRAANSEFSLVPAEGSAGTFIKVAQRVPLRITVQAPPDLCIGPGLSVEIRSHVGSGRGASE